MEPSAPAGLKATHFGFELLLQIHPLGEPRVGTDTEGPAWADSLCCPLRQQKVSKFSPELCDLRTGTTGIILVSVILERRKDSPDQLQDCTAGTCSTQGVAWNVRHVTVLCPRAGSVHLFLFYTAVFCVYYSAWSCFNKSE